MTAVDEAVSTARTATLTEPIEQIGAPNRGRIDLAGVEPPVSGEHTGRGDDEPSLRTAVAPRVTPILERRQRWERQYRNRLILSDLAMVVLVIGTAVGMQLALLGAEPAATWRNGIVLAIFWIAMLSGLRTRDAGVIGSGPREYRLVSHAGLGAFGLLAIIAVLLNWDDLRPLLFIALPIGTVAVLVERWLWRRWLQRRRRDGEFTSRTFVVGSEADVDYVVGSLRGNAHYGYDVVGSAVLRSAEGELVVGTDRYPVASTPESVAREASELGADTIVVAGRPEGSPDFVKRLGWQLEGTAAELVLSSRLADVAGPRISLRQLEGLPLISVKIPSYEGGNLLLKRALDIVVSLLALVPITLLTPLLALLITIDSPGPVFFRQTRIGRDGEQFSMLKFRTMAIDAEERLAALLAQNEGAGVLFKMRNDPRITRVGAVLRKLSLDELPQFWNVLRGDMSVVGPRPPLPREVGEYDGEVYRRLYIKPGITGLWQVSGRSDLSWDESVRLDLRYVENWSVINDVQIMWRTAKVMLRPSGAY